MESFFGAELELIKLKDACKSWLGAKYLHMGCSKGGVDCTKFVGLVLEEIGVIAGIDKDVYYPRDWHIHGKREIVLESFLEHSKLLKVGLSSEILEFTGESNLLFGDVLCLSLNNRLCNHTAFYLGDGKIIHCVQRLGVIEARLSPQWIDKVKKVFRLCWSK